MSSAFSDIVLCKRLKTQFCPVVSFVVPLCRGLAREPEVRLILFFLPLLLIGRLLSGAFVFPGHSEDLNLVQNYIDPVLIAIVVMFFMLRKMDHRSTFLMLVLLFYSLFCMCNFKSWALLNGRNYDALFQATDQALGVAALAGQLHDDIAGAQHGFFSWLYYGLFVFLFVVTMVMMALRRKLGGVREANFSMCLLLLAGGVSYNFFPAYGPFLYRTHGVLDVQQIMQSQCDLVKMTGHFPSGFFTDALGAMPSLHLAFSTLFVCLSWKHYRLLLPLFVLSFAYFTMESMAQGWHYFVDLPAGMLLGVLCFYAGERIRWYGGVLPENAAEAMHPANPVRTGVAR